MKTKGCINPEKQRENPRGVCKFFVKVPTHPIWVQIEAKKKRKKEKKQMLREQKGVSL